MVPADERQAGADQVHDVLELLLLAEDFFAGAAPVGDVLEQQQHAAAFGDLGRGDVHVEITLRLVRGLDAQVRAEERLALRGGAVDGRLQAALLEERGRQEPADVHAVQLFRGAAEEAAEARVREKDAHLRIEHAQARRHRLEDAAVQVEEQVRLLEELRVGDGLRELVGERLHRHHVAVVEGVDLAPLDVDDAERLAVQLDRDGQFGEERGLAQERDDVPRVVADVVGEDGLPVAGDPSDEADAEFLPVALDALAVVVAGVRDQDALLRVRVEQEDAHVVVAEVPLDRLGGRGEQVAHVELRERGAADLEDQVEVHARFRAALRLGGVGRRRRRILYRLVGHRHDLTLSGGTCKAALGFAGLRECCEVPPFTSQRLQGAA